MRAGLRLHPFAIATLAAVLMAAPATARPVAPKPTLVDQRGHRLTGAPVRWLRQARMPLFSGRLMLILKACPAQPQYSGCVYTRRPRRIYLAPRARNPRSVVYHETGHSFDILAMRTRHRRAFKRIAGVRRPGWYSGVISPSELFAEAYALCTRFGTRRPAASRLGYTGSVYRYRPSRSQHRAVCRMIVRLGTVKRRGRPTPAPAPGAPTVAEQVAPPTATAPAPGEPPPAKPQPEPLLPGLPPLPLLPFR